MLFVKIINDGTGSKKKSNYNWSVGVNELTLAAGKIEGHQRAKGWLSLLRKVTREAAKQYVPRPSGTVPAEVLQRAFELLEGKNDQM